MGASEFGVQKEQRPSGYHEGDYPTLTRADVPQGVEIAMIFLDVNFVGYDPHPVIKAKVAV